MIHGSHWPAQTRGRGVEHPPFPPVMSFALTLKRQQLRPPPRKDNPLRFDLYGIGRPLPPSLFACGVAASAFLVLLRGWWRVALGGVALVPILGMRLLPPVLQRPDWFGFCFGREGVLWRGGVRKSALDLPCVSFVCPDASLEAFRVRCEALGNGSASSAN